MTIRLYFTLVVCLVFGRDAKAQFDYLPKGHENQIVNHKYYSLSYSESNEQPEWVAYLLTAQMAKPKVKRKDNFRADPMVSTGSAELKDYAGTGYDRGHLCPAADMRFSFDAMDESFYFSNMSPQEFFFNRGIWSRLESRVRKWAVLYDSLYIATGPVLSSFKDTIGVINRIPVPKFYYKAILQYSPSGTKMIGFLLPNEKSKSKLITFAVSVDSLEQLTRIDFFPFLPDSIERNLESVCKPEDWSFGASAPKSKSVSK